MKRELNFDELEDKWKKRQLDLFPWFDGLITLLRSREGLLMETEKRLSNATQATMVQFLSSADHDNALIARALIKKQSSDSILPILLYSLEKVKKTDFPHRVMESLLDFDPIPSFGYLLLFLNIRQNIQGQVFQIARDLSPYVKSLIPNPQDQADFFEKVLIPMGEDLRERMPASGRVQTMDDFKVISLDLKVMKILYKGTSSWESVWAIEKGMKDIGRDIIVSLGGLPFNFKDGRMLLAELAEVMPYMALMRLKADKPFLKELTQHDRYAGIGKEQNETISEMAQMALKIIDQPDRSIKEITEEAEHPFFFGNGQTP